MDINVFTENQEIQAHLAALSIIVETLRYIKSVGGDLNQCNNQGQTLVHLAAAGDAVNVLNFLKNKSGNNALKAIRYLKQQGANLSISNQNKGTPIHAAAQGGALEVLQYLVEYCKMDITVFTDLGDLPAYLAALCIKVEILRYLKSVGSDLNQCSLVHLAVADLSDNDGFTPSHLTAGNNALKAIRFLKEQGANLSISNKTKSTPVHEAAQGGALEVLQYLVGDCKMDINVSTNNEELPAHLAALRNKVEILRYIKSNLKKQGANLSIFSKEKRTLAHIAAQYGALDILRYLVENCKINVSTDIGNVPAHLAALSNIVEILRHLKPVGSDLNQCNNQGRSLVHLAAEGDAVDVLDFLKN
uniref:Death-associated protein kinase 1-like n=1 Tax=Diabrotica virgifera virgifera TaxID=50390 RepID=A0A6P7G6V9_DIAVI